jgi:uncharacterized damage-inducible protein DinB
MKGHFLMFAAYNLWANEIIYEAADRIPDEKYRADLGAFFGSIHGTLNHLVVADRVWMRRFSGEGPVQTNHDEILFEDRTELAAARRHEDRRIMAWVESLTDDDLAARFTYRTITTPVEVTQPRAPALAHFFNHQTHHRGQVHCLLTMAGGRDAAPSLDLISFQRNTGIGMG